MPPFDYLVAPAGACKTGGRAPPAGLFQCSVRPEGFGVVSADTAEDERARQRRPVRRINGRMQLIPSDGSHPVRGFRNAPGFP